MTDSRNKSLLGRLSQVVIALILLGITTSFIPQAADAATLPPQWRENLARKADTIIVGRVTRVTSMLKSQESGEMSRDIGQSSDYVITKTQIEVILEASKKERQLGFQEVKREVTLIERGGQTETLATRVFGMPTYEVGDQVVLFLEAKRGGHYVTSGLNRGAFFLKSTDPSVTSISLKNLDDWEAEIGPQLAKLDPFLRRALEDELTNASGGAPGNSNSPTPTQSPTATHALKAIDLNDETASHVALPTFLKAISQVLRPRVKK